MSQQDIIRAWKDPEFRNSLSEEQRSQLPENPAGILEMSDESLETIVGGARKGKGNHTGNGTGGHCCPRTGDGTGGNCCPRTGDGTGGNCCRSVIGKIA